MQSQIRKEELVRPQQHLTLELKEEKDFSILIVVLTVRHNSRMEFLSAGFDEYIEKPLDEKK